MCVYIYIHIKLYIINIYSYRYMYVYMYTCTKFTQICVHSRVLCTSRRARGGCREFLICQADLADFLTPLQIKVLNTMTPWISTILTFHGVESISDVGGGVRDPGCPLFAFYFRTHLLVWFVPIQYRYCTPIKGYLTICNMGTLYQYWCNRRLRPPPMRFLFLSLFKSGTFFFGGLYPRPLRLANRTRPIYQKARWSHRSFFHGATFRHRFLLKKLTGLQRLVWGGYGQEDRWNYRSLLQNIVSLIGLFWKRDL